MPSSQAAGDTANAKRYRFYLINAFHLPVDSPWRHRPLEGAKEVRLMNHDMVSPHLHDVDWELGHGPTARYGDWPVENRQEFADVAAGRIPLVKEAIESGKFDAVVLLGGGEPGAMECREVGRRHGVPVTSCAFAQFHYASMLGNKFSVIDMAEVHNMYYYNLVIQHRMDQRCASIRNLDFPLPRPGAPNDRPVSQEKAKALAGEQSDMVDAAIEAAIDAIENDGAEVITFGCSASFWLQPFVKKGLHEAGWDVPVLEGYSCAIELAKSMVNLGIDASSLMFPEDHPKRVRKKMVF